MKINCSSHVRVLLAKLGSEVVSEANVRTQDAAWKNMDEPSGRAIAGVHDKAY